MKKIILIVSLFLLLTGCGLIDTTAPTSEQPTEPSSIAPASEQSTEPSSAEPKESSEVPVPQEKTEFSMEDVIVGSIKYGASREEVKAVFGEPASMETYMQEATAEDITEYTYKNGNQFIFTSYDRKEPILYWVKIVADDVKTARGLGVGSSKSDVLASFKNDNLDDGVLYAAGSKKDLLNETLLIPPRGYINDEPDENGRTAICYTVPLEPYESESDVEEFEYFQHGTMIFHIKDDRVVEYQWFILPLIGE